MSRWACSEDPFSRDACRLRLLDSYGWLAVCGVGILYPYFATGLTPFLPVLGILVLAADQALICSRVSGDLRRGAGRPRAGGNPPENGQALGAMKGAQRAAAASDGRGVQPKEGPPVPREKRLLAEDARLGKPLSRGLWWRGFALGLLFPALQLSGLLDAQKALTGDEPAYLLVSLSLLRDGDLVMDNQYRERQWREFGTRRYGVFAHKGLDGQRYPHHNIGLSVLLLPAVGLGLGDPVRLALLARGFMALLGALAAAELVLLAFCVSGSRRMAIWTVSVACLTVPFGFFGTQLYPEVPAALVVIAVYRRILVGGGFSLGRIASLGVFSGSLVWLHFKYLPLLILLGCFSLWRLWRAGALGVALVARVRRLAVFLLGIAMPVALLVAFVHSIYGVWSPAVVRSGVGGNVGLLADGIGIWGHLIHGGLSFLGYFLDQRIGLLLYSPVYLLALWGLVLLWRRERLQAVEFVLLGLAPILTYSWAYWSMGGYTPPNRPIVPGIPFLAVLAGLGACALGSWHARRLRDLLLGLSLAVSVALLFHNDALYHPMSIRSQAARNQLLAYHGPANFDLTRWLPAYLGESLNFWPNLIFPVGVVLLGGFLLRLASCPELASRLVARRSEGHFHQERGEADTPKQVVAGFNLSEDDFEAGRPPAPPIETVMKTPRKSGDEIPGLRLRRSWPGHGQELWWSRLVLGGALSLMLLIRWDAVARTPLEVERSQVPSALVLAGTGWVEPDGAVWVGGGEQVRILVRDPGGSSLECVVSVPGPNRILLRSGIVRKVLETAKPGIARIDLHGAWRLRRGGRKFLLLEVATQRGWMEPEGRRDLGVRLFFQKVD